MGFFNYVESPGAICIYGGVWHEGWDNLFLYLFLSIWIRKTCLRSGISFVCNVSLSLGGQFWLLIFVFLLNPKPSFGRIVSSLKSGYIQWRLLYSPCPCCHSALRGSCSRVRSDSYVLGSSCCSWHCELRKEVFIVIEMGGSTLIFFGSGFWDMEGLCCKIVEHNLLIINVSVKHCMLNVSQSRSVLCFELGIPSEWVLQKSEFSCLSLSLFLNKPDGVEGVLGGSTVDLATVWGRCLSGISEKWAFGYSNYNELLQVLIGYFPIVY